MFPSGPELGKTLVRYVGTLSKSVLDFIPENKKDQLHSETCAIQES